MTTYLLIALVILQLADLVTTYLINSRPGGRELNPVLAGLFRKVGLLPGLLIIKGAFVALLVWAAPVLHIAVLGLICLGYCWVVWHNVQVLRKQGGV
jgi:hypothetical protein